MESKRLLKISWICITLFLGIIIYFNIHPIPTLIKPGLTITIKNSDGGFFNTTNSVKNLEDAENNFYVKFNIKKVDYVSESDFNIYDNKGKQVPIIDFRSTFAEYSSNYIQIWFTGKANTKYRLVYNDDNNTNHSVNFDTPSKKSYIKKDDQIVKAYVKKYFTNGIKDELTENIIKYNSDSIYANISPYYTPSDKEKKAIVQAYWDAFIKNWKNYSIEMTEASDDKYSYTIRYRWGEPDMEELNRMIDKRENQLKKELGSDYEKLFKKIITEIPTMIRNTSQKEPEEKSISFSIYREEIKALNSRTSFDDISTISSIFKFSLMKLYP